MDSIICYEYINDPIDSLAVEKLYYLEDYNLWTLDFTYDLKSTTTDSWIKYKINPETGKFELANMTISTPVLAHDFDWTQIAHTEDGYVLYADNNFTEDQDFTWVIVKEPKSFHTPENNNADATMMKVFLNCDKNLIRLTNIAYLKNNQIIETDEQAEQKAYKKIQTGTFYEMIASWFCSRG